MSLSKIQAELKAPKGQNNSFGNYKYRSCEDIVEAVKPLLAEYGYHLTLSDELVLIGDRYYIKATASLRDGEKTLESVTGYARESLDKKGMDVSQITGAASSYARKYAASGLFAIDDTKDADTNEHKNNSDNNPNTHEDDEKAWFSDADYNNYCEGMLDKIKSGESTGKDIVTNLRKRYKVSKAMAGKIESLEKNLEAVPH